MAAGPRSSPSTAAAPSCQLILTQPFILALGCKQHPSDRQLYRCVWVCARCRTRCRTRHMRAITALAPAKALARLELQPLHLDRALAKIAASRDAVAARLCAGSAGDDSDSGDARAPLQRVHGHTPSSQPAAAVGPRACSCALAGTRSRRSCELHRSGHDLYSSLLVNTLKLHVHRGHCSNHSLTETDPRCAPSHSSGRNDTNGNHTPQQTAIKECKRVGCEHG